LFDGLSSSKSSLVSQQPIQSLVEELVVLMQSSVDTTLISRADASLDHVASQPIQLVVEEMVMLMQSSTNPTLLLESVEYMKEILQVFYPP